MQTDVEEVRGIWYYDRIGQVIEKFKFCYKLVIVFTRFMGERGLQRIKKGKVMFYYLLGLVLGFEYNFSKIGWVVSFFFERVKYEVYF